MNKYLATVRVRGQHIKTMIYADSAVHARLLLQYQFGMDCMVMGPQATNEAADGYRLLDSMIKPKPPMTPAQARLNGLKQGVARSREQLKGEQERQHRQREAERRRKALASPPP